MLKAQIQMGYLCIKRWGLKNYLMWVMKELIFLCKPPNHHSFTATLFVSFGVWSTTQLHSFHYVLSTRWHALYQAFNLNQVSIATEGLKDAQQPVCISFALTTVQHIESNQVLRMSTKIYIWHHWKVMMQTVNMDVRF